MGLQAQEIRSPFYAHLPRTEIHYLDMFSY